MEQVRKITGLLTSRPPANDGEAPQELKAQDSSVLKDLFRLKIPDALTILQAIKDLASGKPLPDRDLLLEHAVHMLQKLPANSGLGNTVADAFIAMLWKDVPHPAATFLGPEFRYRAADGSNNNPSNPKLGAAGQPYSRTVMPQKTRSPYLPDPELVFDQLLRRRDFIPHKAGLNRLFFSFATVVIHEVFQSDYRKPWINCTSSYVDLSTLYGNNQAEQDKVRTFAQGTIFPDTISSDRIMMMPPGVVACVLLFSRHHNHIAERLFHINETGKYKPWNTLSEEEQKWQDNDIFQLSRNVNVAFFAKVVLGDYVSSILNTVRANSEWHLELGKEIKSRDNVRMERGTGNAVSCEFNVLYHWHAALSAADETWMEDTFKEHCPNTPVEAIGPNDFHMMMGKLKQHFDSTPPSTWTFGGLERRADGYFDDVQLGNLIKSCIEEPARAFSARGTPACLKVVDIMGQLQARNVFQVATMNEFREYLHLTTFKSFGEWNSDPVIAEAAEKLYGHVDNLELYPGLMAEEAKPNIPGSGVQPGHTIGRGILDDAVALVRGDRFLTYDLNITTLTSWGMAQLEPADGSYGGFLPHLLFRALPNAWGTGFSTYSHLPFYTPTAVSEILFDNGTLQKYDQARPPAVTKLHGLHSFQACKEAFQNTQLFAVQYGPNVDMLTNNAGFLLAWDDPVKHDAAKRVMNEAFFEPGFEAHVRSFYTNMTRKKIADSSVAYDLPAGRNTLDAVRDIFNVVPIFWAADKFGIPLKTQETPHGLMTLYELHLLLLALFIFSSFDLIADSAWKLRGACEQFAPSFRKILEARYVTTRGPQAVVSDLLTRGSGYELSDQAKHLYRTFHAHNIPMAEAVGSMFGTILPVAGNITQQPALLLDLFLEPEYKYAKDRLVELAGRDDEASYAEFEMWIWEGMRVRPIVPGLPREAMQDVVIKDGDRKVRIKRGDKVVIATSKAHLDPTMFPDPYVLNPTRSKMDYIHLGAGMHFCLGARLCAPAFVSMLREVFKLPNLRRAKGAAGTLIGVHEALGHNKDACVITKYIDANCREGPVPTSLVVEYGPE